jgi:hypothetical protein
MAIGVLAIVLRSVPEDLTRSSTPVWRGADWIPGTDFWLSNDTFRAITAHNGHASMLELTHIASGTPVLRSRPLPMIDKAIIGSTFQSPQLSWNQLSLNCDWSVQGHLLWQTLQGLTDNRVTALDPLSGKTSPTTSPQFIHFPAAVKWLPDGRRAVILALVDGAGSDMFVVDPSHPGHYRYIDVTSSFHGSILGFDRQGRVVTAPSLDANRGFIDFVAKGRMAAPLPPDFGESIPDFDEVRKKAMSPPLDSGVKFLSLYPLDTPANKTSPLPVNVAVPRGYQVVDIALNRSGDTLLWTLGRITQPPGNWLERLLGQLIHRRQYMEFSVWTSRLGQLRMNQVGAVWIEPPSYVPAPAQALHVTWLPDGNGFSFVCRNRLYIHRLSL